MEWQLKRAVREDLEACLPVFQDSAIYERYL